MLVLGREINETIVITLPDGQRITITCCEIRPTKCRIGVTADPAFTVHRGEIQRQIDSEATPGIGEDFG